ncbi:MAG: hypothetical protein RL685_5170 [Pseudomonadota bacterium]|jgi:hypothetical protein
MMSSKLQQVVKQMETTRQGSADPLPAKLSEGGPSQLACSHAEEHRPELAFPPAGVTMKQAKPCPACGRQPECHASYAVSCVCPNCYDGAADSHPIAQLCGWGQTSAQAVEAWNERVQDVAASPAGEAEKGIES